MELDVDQKQEEMVAEEKAGEEEQAEGGGKDNLIRLLHCSISVLAD